MSHIVTVKTELNDLGIIKAALTFLGLPFKENGTVRMWGRNTKAEVVISLPNYDIGIKKDPKTDTYVLEYDNYAIAEVFQTRALVNYPKVNFTGILTQATNIVKAKLAAAQENMTIRLSEPDANGMIHALVETA